MRPFPTSLPRYCFKNRAILPFSGAMIFWQSSLTTQFWHEKLAVCQEFDKSHVYMIRNIKSTLLTFKVSKIQRGKIMNFKNNFSLPFKVRWGIYILCSRKYSFQHCFWGMTKGYIPRHWFFFAMKIIKIKINWFVRAEFAVYQTLSDLWKVFLTVLMNKQGELGSALLFFSFFFL